MFKAKILIADNDPVDLKLLQNTLKERDYQIFLAHNGADVLLNIDQAMPDIIILEKTLPKMDGLNVCSRIREWSQVPIIMLDADPSTEEKVKCLMGGADDYLSKPFDLQELTARISVMLRRTQKPASYTRESEFTAGSLKINFAARRVFKDGTQIKLTPTEFNVLQELALNVGKVLSHSHLLKKIWGPEYSDETEYLRVFINRLRQKLEPQPLEPRYIVTSNGVGYMFNRRSPVQLPLSEYLATERRL